MADIFTITSPMLVRYPDSELRLVAEVFRTSKGLVYAEPFWLETDTPSAYLLAGEVTGDGPWKIDGVIVRLLSCGDTDYKMQWAEWEQYLSSVGADNKYQNTSYKHSIINKMSFCS